MFDDVNKAGRMLQDRLAMIPPVKLAAIVDNTAAISQSAREVMEFIAGGVRKIQEAFRATT